MINDEKLKELIKKMQGEKYLSYLEQEKIDKEESEEVGVGNFSENSYILNTEEMFFLVKIMEDFIERTQLFLEYQLNTKIPNARAKEGAQASLKIVSKILKKAKLSLKNKGIDIDKIDPILK